MIVPSLPYDRIVRALRRAGWVVVLQKGCHIRLQKQTVTKTLELTVPALRPVLGSTLAHILKHAQLTVDEFNDRL
jgi:predicted RNA binding protein YcfA (HicA-like mRNA interferase family)